MLLVPKKDIYPEVMVCQLALDVRIVVDHAGDVVDELDGHLGQVVARGPGYLAGYAVLMLLCMVLMDAGYRLLLDRKSCGT